MSVDRNVSTHRGSESALGVEGIFVERGEEVEKKADERERQSLVEIGIIREREMGTEAVHFRSSSRIGESPSTT